MGLRGPRSAEDREGLRLPAALLEMDQGVIPAGFYRPWVRVGTLLAMAGYFVLTLLRLAVTRGDLGSVLPEIGVLVAGVGALWLEDRGRAGRAAALIAGAVWLELHLSLYAYATLEAAALVALPSLVMGAGLLVGGRASITIALVTCVSAPLAAAAGRRIQGLGPELLSQQDVNNYIVLVPSLLFPAALVMVALRTAGRALRSANRSEARLRERIDSAPDGILELDGDGVTTSANPAAARVLGIRERDLLGRPLEHVLDGTGGPGRGGAEGGEPLGPLLAGEARDPVLVGVRTPDARVWVEGTSERTRRADGSVRVQVVLRDVTARVHAQDRAAQLGRILEGALNEIYVIDPVEACAVLASQGARENLGYASEEIARLRPDTINPAFTPGRLAELAEELGERTGAIVTGRGIHRRRNGSVYPVETRVQTATLDGRTVLVVFAVDISERVRAEEEQRHLQRQLEHAQRMEAVGQLAGGVAHDFNNLLMVVGGCADILAEEGDGMVKQLAGEILTAQERGAALTRQLLAFARREVVQPRVLDLRTVLPESRPFLQRLLGKDVDLEISVEGAPRILVDRGQLDQVLLNLASNARDAMPEGGAVTLTARFPAREADGDFVVLAFSDDGPGMDAEVVNRAFEPFFTSKPRGQGTGLGLSTVHGIVTQNGGTVRLDSAPGQGTSVVMLMPQVPEDLAPREEGSEEAAVPGHRGKVLVVEDDDGARGLVHLILERAGYRVVTASDARRALREVEKADEPFDLLLTDVVMPGRSGLELADDVRGLLPGIPILYMSGYMDDEVLALTDVDPDRHVLLKPFRAHELRARVGEALDRADGE